MTRFLQNLKNSAFASLAAVIAGFGADTQLKAMREPREEAAASPRHDALKQPSATQSPPVVGFVRDKDFQPIAGATVVVGQFGGGEPNHLIATTRPDGHFELTPSGKSARLEYVLAYKKGLAPASALRLEGHGDQGAVELVLSEPVPFVGVVKNHEGKSVAGAAVRIQHAQYPGIGGAEAWFNVIEKVLRGTPLDQVFQTKTDGRGRFVFPALPREAKTSLVVTAAGMGEYNTMNRLGRDGRYEGLVGTADAPAEIVLAPAARVSGRIVSRFASLKVSGLKVAMQGVHGSNGIWAETVTDAEGRFEFGGLAEGKANIFLRDLKTNAAWTHRAAADTVLRPGETTEAQIELIKGLRVDGMVVDAETGEPVAGVGVGLYGPIRPSSGAAIISAKTNKEGRYQFRLPPGETFFYLCGPVPPEYAREQRGGCTVRIPADAPAFTVPTITIRRAMPER